MKVDPKKKYKTRNGVAVTGLHIDNSYKLFPVRGFTNGMPGNWTIDGKFWSTGAYSEKDLIEVKEKKVAKKTTKKPVKKVVSRKKSVPKEPMVVSMEKCYETKCGYPARIYATDGVGDYPVHGASCEGGDWIQTAWTANGIFSIGEDGGLDLVEVPKRVTVAHWVNILQCEGGEYTSEGYGSESDAIEAGKSLAMDETLFARVKVEVKCSQGEGL